MAEWVSITLLAFALGADAFSVSLAVGMTRERSSFHLLKIAGTVGVFHMIMPFLGMAIGVSLMAYYGHEIAAMGAGILLAAIGVQMIWASRSREEAPMVSVKGVGVLLFAFIVSLDSFSIGISLGVFGIHILAVVLTFGIVSALLTWIGLSLAVVVRQKTGNLGEFAAGLFLLLFSLKTVAPSFMSWF